MAVRLATRVHKLCAIRFVFGVKLMHMNTKVMQQRILCVCVCVCLSSQELYIQPIQQNSYSERTAAEYTSFAYFLFVCDLFVCKVSINAK